MIILVTGGLGFIGHNIVYKLQQLGHEVVVLDNMTDYGSIPSDEHQWLIEERRKKFNPETKIIKLDADTLYSITNSIAKKLDAVIHLAQYPRQSVVKKIGFEKAIESSVKGLVNLCESLSLNHDKSRLVYISSSMVYGDFTDDVTEDAILSPKNEYGLMKSISEKIVKNYSDIEFLDHTIIRPSAVYGPSDVGERIVAKFLLSAMRDETLYVNGPDEKLDFTYVDDLAEGIVRATLSENTRNKTYNLTRGRSRTILEAAQTVVDIVGKGKIEIREKTVDMPSRGMLNIDQARKDFDYEPTVDIQEGFRNYYRYLCDSPFWSSKTIR